MRINGFTPDESIFNTIGSSSNSTNGSTNLSDIFKSTLDSLNEKQVIADNITSEFIAGGDVEIHEVMLATEEAKMSLQLAVQVRNKIVEAVQELTRMQL